jgi:hypothetical protein
MIERGDQIMIHPPNREPEPICDCFVKVEEYCRPFDEDEGGVAAYEGYDKLRVRQDDTLSAIDILLANNIGANLSGQDFVRIRKNRERIESRLTEIPTGLDLSETSLNDEDLWESLHELFKACRCKGVGSSKITKILHKKRPRLIPIVDSELVAGKYLGSNLPSASDVPEYLVAATKHIRKDLTSENNSETLIALQERLWQEKQIHLTPLRIFDILLHQYYIQVSAK